MNQINKSDELRLPLPRVRVNKVLDILRAYRHFGDSEFEISIDSDSGRPSLVKVMRVAVSNGQCPEAARVQLANAVKQNPREYQPSINGFIARVKQMFGAFNADSIERAHAEMILAGNLMVSDVNEMSLREFNRKWDELNIRKRGEQNALKLIEAVDSALSQIDPQGREACLLIAMFENDLVDSSKRL